VEDLVDPAVCIKVMAKPGGRASGGRSGPGCTTRRGRLDQAIALATRAIRLGDERPAATPLIVGGFLADG
jgi:hypothetical protein